MSPADFLLTLAEISIAFVGFSAIVIVFRRFAAGPDSRFQSLQVSVIIQIGLLALFLSLLPLLLGLFPLEEAPVWRTSSSLFALAVVLRIASYVRSRSGLPVPAAVTQSTYLIRMTTIGLIAVLQLLNAFLLPNSWLAGVYCAGVVSLLLMLAWVFVGIWRLWGGPEVDKP